MVVKQTRFICPYCGDRMLDFQVTEWVRLAIEGKPMHVGCYNLKQEEGKEANA